MALNPADITDALLHIIAALYPKFKLALYFIFMSDLHDGMYLCPKSFRKNLDVSAKAILQAKAILVNPQHPLFSEFRLLPSGCRYAPSNRKAKNNRYTRSFVPSAVVFINELLKQA